MQDGRFDPLRNPPAARICGCRSAARPPALSGAAQLLADALAWQARGEHGPAERLGRAALALEPGNAEALQLVGLALRARGELDEDAALLRRAAALRPGDPDLLNNLG